MVFSLRNYFSRNVLSHLLPDMFLSRLNLKVPPAATAQEQALYRYEFELSRNIYSTSSTQCRQYLTFCRLKSFTQNLARKTRQR